MSFRDILSAYDSGFCRSIYRMPKPCQNDPDSFCYISGKYTLGKQSRRITSSVRQLYKAYFEIDLGDQDKPWAPHTVCVTCISRLGLWSKGKSKSMPFGIPMVWREQKNHHDDCYFCMVKPLGKNAQSRKFVQYPNIPSAMRPVPHSDEVPIPAVPLHLLDIRSSETSSSEGKQAEDEEYNPSTSRAGKPQCFTQDELDDLVRDLGLSRESAQLLCSRLAEKNFLAVKHTLLGTGHENRHFCRTLQK